ncbi:MAG: aspartate--tRNA(Asn) ligase [Ktedonobacterales bacterium]|nr:aspartate--tRNA(Asn) ligase [Ktedonobacterales bacterium]
MTRIFTTDLPAHVGEQVSLAGWLQSLRRMGGITFLVLRDGWGTAQAVIETEDSLQPLTAANALPESLIRVTGTVQANAAAPNGCELHHIAIEVCVPISEAAPIPLGKRTITAGQNTILDHAMIANRHVSRRATLRLSAGIMEGFRASLRERDFTEVQTPKIVAAATEGGANVFALDYFGRTAYLAQSPQFYKQMMVGIFERVFEVGPVFRAEPHDTTRHINEYVSLDVEMGFIEDHHTVMAVLRAVLHGIMATLQRSYAADLAVLELALPAVPTEIPSIHFAEAQTLIWRETGQDVRSEPDLAPADERWLGAWAQRTFGSDFLFVTGYPMRKRPFYTHPDPARPAFSNSFDLLFRGVELVTGGQRLHRYGDYLAALEHAGLAIEPFAPYLETFRYGMPSHGGFAIGLERLVMQLTGVSSIKLATTFPRDLHRLTP